MNRVAASERLFPIPTALVVDSDPDVCELYSVMLADVASAIDQQHDGRFALARALERPPHLLVANSQLPFIDGYSLCRLLRADPSTSHVPIIIATADDTSSGVQRAITAGADAVIATPCLIEPFVATVRDVLNRGRDLRSRSEAAREMARVAVERSAQALEHARNADRTKSKRHFRHLTSSPPIAPPALRCPVCDRALRYQHSHIGGVTADHPEQWDYFDCPTGCGAFQYRERTRKLRRLV